MSDNNLVVASIPSLVTSEDRHGPSFSSVVIVNKTWRQEKKLVKDKACWSSLKTICVRFEASIPSLVTSEDCHGQSFSAVVIVNKTWRQEKKLVKDKACWSSLKTICVRFEASIPSLVTSEDCHGQSFSSVVIVNKTWRQEKKLVKDKACWSSLKTICVRFEASTPSLVTSEDCHGQSFSSVVIVNKTWRQEKKLVKDKACWSSLKTICVRFEASIPSLVTSEDCHGQSFSSVVIVNKTWRQDQKQN